MKLLIQRRRDFAGLLVVGAIPWLSAFSVFGASFINFETAPTHPMALSTDNQVLAVCNLPDNRVELFDVTSGLPVPLGDVPVGLDPVSVRFRTTNELWVVNHISCSVSIVDRARRVVVATLDTLAGPADVVFAGSPERAFVSCARTNAVMVFDPVGRTGITNIAIDGERPRALAVSPDRSKVYVAIFESGNGTTILGRRLTEENRPPVPGVVENTNGPYGGQNPPPNAGAGFSPPRNPNVTNKPPLVSHIVRKNAGGRWIDDNDGDWTEFVSGTDAALSGRVQGWDLPDHDVAVIDTSTLNVTYIIGLMNLCMAVDVNPVSGQIAVVGTDGTNERRFEPNLNGVFLRVNLALIDPVTRAKSLFDLNPHLDYQTRTVPSAERDKSIGDPRGIVWNAAGTRGYVSGMGSRNLIIIGANGHRLRTQPIDLGEGPTGLALDESRQRLYVLNRFSASVSVIDTATDSVIATVPFFDPTPAAIKNGRRHLYDTRKTSGLGHVSCASCHPDARMDRLAWDLGDPAGTMVTNQSPFHPMKGPMVTQTLQDILLDEFLVRTPLHWRGDRAGIEDFNQTFTNLLAGDTALTTNEMQEFKGFLTNIFFPPNPLRTFQNGLLTNMPLPGMFGRGLDGHTPNGPPLPVGNAAQGNSAFAATCALCHEFNRGGGQFGSPLARETQRVRNAQLRNLPDKLGMDMTRTNSRAGFGFIHDGTVDSLSRFLLDGFGDDVNVAGNDQQVANVIAFVLSFSGSGLNVFNNATPSRDVPAAVGKQNMVTTPATNELLGAMLDLARNVDPETLIPRSRVELVARGIKGSERRGWLYKPEFDWFQSDRNSEHYTFAELLALASPSTPLTFMMVPFPSGQRIALDRDEDGYFDRTELDYGTDPANAFSSPLRLTTLARTGNMATVSWNSVTGETYWVWFKTNFAENYWMGFPMPVTATSRVTTVLDTNLGTARQRFYRVIRSE
jgi:YVTN family beta-propeller protein